MTKPVMVVGSKDGNSFCAYTPLESGYGINVELVHEVDETGFYVNKRPEGLMVTDQEEVENFLDGYASKAAIQELKDIKIVIERMIKIGIEPFILRADGNMNCLKNKMTKEEQRELILRSVEEWNEYRLENPQFVPDLSKADLRKVDLRKANLSEADLYGADLSEADLRKANLYWANLSEADLRKANLSEADLRKANLSEADLRKADLSKANLKEANLFCANLSWTNLSWTNLSWTNLSWTNLTETDLD